MNVEVTARGNVGDRAKQAARSKVADLERYVDGPVMGARVVLTQEENPRIEHPARAEGEVIIAGKPVRARVTAANMDAAVDELAERLRVRMRQFVERRVTKHRRSAEAEAGEWFHGARRTPDPRDGAEPPYE